LLYKPGLCFTSQDCDDSYDTYSDKSGDSLGKVLPSVDGVTTKNSSEKNDANNFFASSDDQCVDSKYQNNCNDNYTGPFNERLSHTSDRAFENGVLKEAEHLSMDWNLSSEKCEMNSEEILTQRASGTPSNVLARDLRINRKSRRRSPVEFKGPSLGDGITLDLSLEKSPSFQQNTPISQEGAFTGTSVLNNNDFNWAALTNQRSADLMNSLSRTNERSVYLINSPTLTNERSSNLINSPTSKHTSQSVTYVSSNHQVSENTSPLDLTLSFRSTSSAEKYNTTRSDSFHHILSVHSEKIRSEILLLNGNEYEIVPLGEGRWISKNEYELLWGMKKSDKNATNWRNFIPKDCNEIGCDVSVLDYSVMGEKFQMDCQRNDRHVKCLEKQEGDYLFLTSGKTDERAVARTKCELPDVVLLEKKSEAGKER